MFHRQTTACLRTHEVSVQRRTMIQKIMTGWDDWRSVQRYAMHVAGSDSQIEKANAKITSLEAQLQTAAMSKLNVEVECRQAQDKMRQMETLLEQMREAREKYEKSTELEEKYVRTRSCTGSLPVCIFTESRVQNSTQSV